MTDRPTGKQLVFDREKNALEQSGTQPLHQLLRAVSLYNIILSGEGTVQKIVSALNCETGIYQFAMKEVVKFTKLPLF